MTSAVCQICKKVYKNRGPCSQEAEAISDIQKKTNLQPKLKFTMNAKASLYVGRPGTITQNRIDNV